MNAALGVFTIAAEAFVAVALVAFIIQLASSSRPFDALTRAVGKDALRGAFLVALVATAGSLYYSEVRHFTPCIMCWYQRILMYPLAVILGIAAFRNDRGIAVYGVPLAAIGLLASLFHIKLETWGGSNFCAKTGPSCEIAYFHQFGYITIAVMAASAFALIITLLTIGARHGQGISREA